MEVKFVNLTGRTVVIRNGESETRIPASGNLVVCTGFVERASMNGIRTRKRVSHLSAELPKKKRGTFFIVTRDVHMHPDAYRTDVLTMGECFHYPEEKENTLRCAWLISH